MKNAFVAAVCASLLLGGCSGWKPQMHTELYGLDSNATRVNFDRRLLEECPPLPSLPDSTDAAILQNYGDITTQYAVCRNQKKALNDQVKDILDLKDDGTGTVKPTAQVK